MNTKEVILDNIDYFSKLKGEYEGHLHHIEKRLKKLQSELEAIQIVEKL